MTVVGKIVNMVPARLPFLVITQSNSNVGTSAKGLC